MHVPVQNLLIVISRLRVHIDWAINLNLHLNHIQFLYLTTIGRMTGKEHQIEIWFVKYEGKYYVISERREKAQWVQNIIHYPKVSFTVGDNKINGNARIVNKDMEHKLASEVSKLMDEKYKWSQGMILELTAINPAN